MNKKTTQVWALALLLLLCCASNRAAAQAPYVSYGDTTSPPPAAPRDTVDWSWTYSVVGVRMSDTFRNDVMTGDDFSGYVTNHHCNSEFLFVVYEGDTVQQTPYYRMADFDRMMLGIPLTINFKWELSKDGIAIADGYRHERNPLFITAPFAGYYEMTYTSEVGRIVGPDTIRDQFKVRFLAIKRAESISVEPVDFCTATHTVGEDFRFKVITTPSLYEIFPAIPQSHGVWHGATGSCNSASDLDIKLNFTMQTPDPSVASVYSAISGSTAHIVPKNNFTFGVGLPHQYIWPSTWGDEQDFYFKNSEFASYFSDALQPIIGTVSYDDNYLVTKEAKFILPVLSPSSAANENNGGAFYLHEYNKATAQKIDATYLSSSMSAPAHETWTPTSNPMVAEGYGSNIPVLRIKDKLVIGKGQSLTLNNMIIEMGKDAQIIVESDPAAVQEAGYLKLNNSTIRAYKDCGNEDNLWAGIILQGNSHKNQNPLGGDYYKRYQAMLYSVNSTIANAAIAVRTYEPSAPTLRTGGIVMAWGTTFSNNVVSVDYKPYPKPLVWGGSSKPYVNNFSNCSFVVGDANMGSTFEGFVRAQAVSGIKFSQCSFITDYGTTMRGYGIKGTDMGLTVVGSVASPGSSYFKGLYEAISLNKGSLFHTASLKVMHSKFVQNYTAIHTRGVLNPSITNNVMEIPKRDAPIYGRNTAGINIETGSGYSISQNTFKDITGSTRTSRVGTNAVLVWNSGSSPNHVIGNTLYKLQQGLISNYINRNIPVLGEEPKGLQFLCNSQHIVVGTNIAALGANPGTDGMRARQGEASKPAGNTFAHVDYDIYNPTAEVGPVTYYFGLGANKEPTINSSSVFTSSSFDPDGCATGLVDRSFPPILIDPEGHTEVKLRDIVHNNIDYYIQSDSPGRSAALHSLLTQLDDAYSDLARVDLYLSEGDATTATTLYNGIVSSRSLTGSEAYEFGHWGAMLLGISDNLLQAGKAPTELSPAQISTLSLVADSATMWAKVRAQNWLNAYDGRVYVNTFLYPPTDSSNIQRRTIEDELVGGAAANNAIYPNPANTYIDVAYTPKNDKGIAAVIELRDMMGRIVLQQTLNNKGTQRIGIEKLPASVYLYRISEEGNTTMSGKLIKK